MTSDSPQLPDPDDQSKVRDDLPTLAHSTNPISELPNNIDTTLAFDQAGNQQARPGSRQIGPYKLLQQIGEGGMGTVWMAEQEEPVRRRVAIKLVKAGHDSKEVLARFEAERQAVAMMDHQNIAKVLDAGVTEHGQPYFAMELVQGIAFTKYCNDNQLNPRERLELFIPVCRAIQHAHQKGIIHRDIKPSNVLVTLYDGNPVPKVIDFGLAKALQHSQQLTDKTMFTEYGKVVGTLNYMSPEQAEMNALDVDTRTDIYSLGVMLYELLTGSTPLDEQTTHGKAFLQVLMDIRESDPPRPSSRLSETVDAATGISEQRGTDTKKLLQLLRGDLDWIVMKALEKDRTRRYETAAAFAEDVQRFLDNEPIEARPPTVAYRTSKFLRKYWIPASALTAVFITLVLGFAGTFFGMNSARKAAEIAELEKTRAQKVKDHLINMLQSPDPEQAGRDARVLDLLDTTAKEIETEFAEDPQTQAELYDAMTETYFNLAMIERANDANKRAQQIRREGVDDVHGRLTTQFHSIMLSENLGDIAWSMLDLGKEASEKLGYDEVLTLRAFTAALNSAISESDKQRAQIGLLACLDAVEDKNAADRNIRSARMALRRSDVSRDFVTGLMKFGTPEFDAALVEMLKAQKDWDREVVAIVGDKSPDYYYHLMFRTLSETHLAIASRQFDLLQDVESRLATARQLALNLYGKDSLQELMAWISLQDIRLGLVLAG
ncbi:MAG: serine/threonine-protein kinase, partial [Planctomycetota bacterium]